MTIKAAKIVYKSKTQNTLNSKVRTTQQHQVIATCNAFKCSIPHPPLDGSFTNLYFLGCLHPLTSHFGISLALGGSEGLFSTAPGSSISEGGTENDSAGQSCLLVEIQRNMVGISGGVGMAAGVESSSFSSPSSSGSTRAFFPRGRLWRLRSLFIVSV